MFSYKSRNIISLSIVLSINLLFLLKFSIIYYNSRIILPLAYIVIFLFITWVLNKALLFNKISRASLIAVTILQAVMLLLIVMLLPRYGEIGRLPAIEDWISRFNFGLFPYNSKYAPSSFPVLFFLAMPFYYLGNTGFLSYLGILLFLLLLVISRKTLQEYSMQLFLFIYSVIIYYEILTRSELIFNVMLVILVVSVCEKKLKSDLIDNNLFLSAVLTGLVLSTRSISVLLFLIYFIYRFRNNISNLLLFGFISVILFLITVIPFYFWDPDSFIARGPFAVQTYVSNLPQFFIFLLFLSSIFLGWRISNISQFYFSGGVLLFASALTSFLLKVTESSFSPSLVDDGYDIAYFIFCVPLLILSITDSKVNNRYQR